MKRSALIKQLEKAGCILARHGGRHDIYQNRSNGRRAPVPRHREIPPTLAKIIMKQLGVQDNKQQT